MSDSRTADKFVIRMPDGMRDKIKEDAKNNHRSTNAQIVAVLDEYLKTTTTRGTL